MGDPARGSRRGGVVRRLARTAANLVYRDIDVHLPPEQVQQGPVLAVANHFGGLADGVLLVDTSPRRPRIVARDVIWKVPVVGRLATAAGMIPVHRSADGGGRASNDEMFSSAYESLAEGDLVLIFPEGVTMDVPHMAEVRTGAARIALGARESGVQGLRILPVGVHYEDKAAFRSRALVNIGSPIPLEDWAASHGPIVGGADDRQAVRALTAVIDEHLRQVAPNYPDWNQAHALETAAEVLLTDVDPTAPPPVDYGDVALLGSRLNRLPEPARSELVSVGADYRDALRQARTTDHAVATATAPVRSWGWAWDVALVALLLPFAVMGLIVSSIPLALVLVASRLRIAPAVRATVVPGLATLLFLIEWGLVAFSRGEDGSLEFGLLAAVLFPFLVAAMLFVAERLSILWLRRRRHRRPRGGQLSRLQALRGAVAEKGWAAL